MTEESKASAGPIKELSGRIGKYDILKPLGKGAMGMVYLAHDTILERDVALKVMVSQIADDPELKTRFEREAKAVAKMTHPNVVQVFDLGNHTDGSPFIAMELLKGMDLQKAIRTPPPMGVDRKVGIIVQVLQGLAHAHQAGIVHRDIKPANIFINQDGSVKIMDFGVARLTTASMTGTGNIVGTADYMSPEQVKGAKVDGRSDLFSVGCMLYELLAGKRPFHSENLMAIFYKITHEEPDFDAIPEGPDFDALMPTLKKALAKELADRYQTAYEFAVDLREYLKSHASGAPGETGLEGLLDMEAPATAVSAGTMDADGATLITAEDGEGAPTNLKTSPGRGTSATVRAAGPGTARTRVAGAAGPTVVVPQKGQASGTARTRVMPSEAPTTYGSVHHPAPSSGNPILYAVLGALVVGLAVAGGYIYLNRKPPEPPPTTMASVPSTAPETSVPATTLAPATPAPPPTMAAVTTQSKAGAALRAGQAAFKSGSYDKAIASFQSALVDEPDNADARRMLENAQSGQQAMRRLASAESALRANDYGKALSEAQAARDQAPWDSRATDFIQRVQREQSEAQSSAQAKAAQQAQAAAAAQVNGLLSQAEAALATQKYDAAIALYDEALKLDANNQRATLGRTSALAAKAVSQAGGPGPKAGKSFVVAKTTASSAETKSSHSGPSGFEDTPGVVVKKGTQAAELPGKVLFEVQPEAPKPGDRYTVKVYLLNEGSAPIQVVTMLVKTTINGRGASAPVPPLVKDVAPQQKALVLNLSSDVWKEDTQSWAMEVTVKTARGETYTNQVSWK